MLDYSFAADLPHGRASGAYSEGKRQFSIDYRARKVSIDGYQRDFDKQSVQLAENDIFVDCRLLADWFPVDIEFDRNDAAVNFKPRELLPLDNRAATTNPKAVDPGRTEIPTPSVDLVATSGFGRRADSFSPRNLSGNSDSTTIGGELPPGWEVELYRNGVLIDSRESRSNRRYEFAAVPLLPGANVLQLQFFGPEGQYRQQTRRILAGAAQLQPGKLNYRVAISRDETAEGPTGIEDRLSYRDRNTEGTARASAELEYAATGNIALMGSTRAVPRPEGYRSYFGLGARFHNGPMQGRLDLSKERDGGMAGTVGTRLNLPFNLVLSGKQGLYDNFSSEEIPDDGDLPVSTTEGQLAGFVPLWAGRRVPFKFIGNYENSQSGASILELGNQLSFSAGGLSVSNDVRWRQNWSESGTTNNAGGTFSLGTWGGDGRIRGNVGYAIEPEMELTSALLTGEWLFGQGLKARAGLKRNFSNSVNSLNASLARQFEAFSLCVTGNYSENDAAVILFTLGISGFANWVEQIQR